MGRVIRICSSFCNVSTRSRHPSFCHKFFGIDNIHFGMIIKVLRNDSTSANIMKLEGDFSKKFPAGQNCHTAKNTDHTSS